MNEFNDRVKQILLLALIILLVFTSLNQLRSFIPGILAAITLYILSREKYFNLVFERKWKKGWASFTFLAYYLLLLGAPIFLGIMLISPKVNEIMNDPSGTIEKIKTGVAAFQEKVGMNFISEKSLDQSLEKASAAIPGLLNSSANLFTNLVLMLFMLYYMLYYGKEIERFLFKAIPLKNRNISLLAAETKKMIRANALGIPIISIIQGVFATVGYMIFKVDNWGLWGLLTGIFAFFPVIGTMIIWVPIVIFMYSSDQNWQATGLLIYSLVVTGNVDYLARMTLMRKMSNVHPVMTILGVLVGLGLFGFIGLIFGPLLLSYIVVLFKIYMNEFADEQTAAETTKPQNGKKQGST